MKCMLAFIFICFQSLYCHAEVIYSALGSFEGGKNFSSFHFDISADRETQKNWFFSGWDLSAGGMDSHFKDESTGEKLSYTARDVSLGFDFRKSQDWLISLSGSGSETPETQYSQSNGDLYLQYSRAYNQPLLLEGEEKGFSPSWSFGVGNSIGTIKQRLSLTVLSQTVVRDVELYQDKWWVSIGWTPSPSYSFYLTGAVYSYSRTKSNLQRVFNNRFLNSRQSDLISSIASLPESSVSLRATYILNDEWDVSISGSEMKKIVDDTYIKRTEMLVTHSMGEWLVGVGGTLESEPTTDVSALLELGYIW